MAIIQVEPNTVGRPSAKSKTVRIQPTGDMRLSPDLCIADTFQIELDKEKWQLIVAPNGPFKLWYSSPHAKSGLLTLTAVFAELGVKPRKLSGEYIVRPLKHVGFIVDLRRV